MIEFNYKSNKIILIYYSDYSNSNWIIDNFMNDKEVTLGKTYNFRIDDLYKDDNETETSLIEFYKNEDNPEYTFDFASLKNDYYEISKRVLGISNSLFIHKSIKIRNEYFVAEKNISIFKKIDKLVKEDIYIGGKNPNAIPKNEFLNIIHAIPNVYEINSYVDARISTILKNYLDTTLDSDTKYNNYMNKKISIIGTNLTNIFLESELFKYNTIYNKLINMLENEINYNENAWQNEILQIIQLLYPKFIKAFSKVRIKDTYNDKWRELDYLLVDATGNIDIIEIKKPFYNCIVTESLYRDNYIPLRELSGTVMQIEKYIFYLNKWGKGGENYLTKKLKNELPQNFRIKIINPSGIIIMGRENNLNINQKQDFEVIKRKYKNIVDIITYDDLLQRLKFSIELLEN
jgi:hypothetical protein